MASIQETLRSLLGADPGVSAWVGDRIYPGQIPDDEVETPWLYYAVPESTPYDDLGDGTSEAQHQVEFHSLADTYAAAKAVIDAVVAALNTFVGGQITRAFWEGRSEESTEDGYHHVVRFTVWSTLAVVVRTPGSRARLTTGLDSVTVQAGGHTLTLTSAGLLLDGGAVGSASVASVFGRSGAVTARAGDYSAGQVSNAADTTAANVFAAGPNTFEPASGSVAAVRVAALPGQTVPVIEVKDPGGATGLQVGPAGQIRATPSVGSYNGGYVHCFNGSISTGYEAVDWVQIAPSIFDPGGVSTLLRTHDTGGVGYHFRATNSSGDLFTVNANGDFVVTRTAAPYTAGYVGLFSPNFFSFYDPACDVLRISPTGIYQGVLSLIRAVGIDGTTRFVLGGDGAVTVTPAATAVGQTIKCAPSHAANLIELQDNGGSVMAAFDRNAGWKPPHMSDSTAANDTAYFSTTSGKLAYKDPGGVVNNLY